MKIYRAIVCSVFVMVLGLSVVGQNKPQDKDRTTGKPQIYESGFIARIDAKKKIIIVHGVSNSFPELPSEPSAKGRGGDGRDSNENTLRDMRVYVYPDTLIQMGAATLKFEDLKETAQVTIIGASKGKSGDIDALSISVLEKQ